MITSNRLQGKQFQSRKRSVGDDYHADQNTFTMGFDQRFTAHLAERFRVPSFG
ncbi:MAG: hypothetical protein ABIF77_19475 [bacterium]